MDFPKSPPELIEKFEALVPKYPDITNRKMFGYPVCFINGNMFIGLHEFNMILRLPEAARADFLTQTDSHIFEPVQGHKMKEYVVVPDELMNNKLNEWLEISMTYVRSLPPKVKKRKVKG